MGSNGTCTPKCIPQIETAPTATVSFACTGQGAGRNITVTLELSALTANCPCVNDPASLGSVNVSSTNGNAVISGNTVTVDLGRGETTTFDVTVSRSVSCPDRDGSTCAITCGTTFGVSVTVPNQGNCNGVAAEIVSTTSSCS